MSLPKDIAILVSMLNMKLRDDDMALETIIETQNEQYDEIMQRLLESGYVYDPHTNQLKQK